MREDERGKRKSEMQHSTHLPFSLSKKKGFPFCPFPFLREKRKKKERKKEEKKTQKEQDKKKENRIFNYVRM